jgi:hypothetical protein
MPSTSDNLRFNMGGPPAGYQNGGNGLPWFEA